MRRSYLAALLSAVMALSLIPIAAVASGTPEITREQALSLLSQPQPDLADTEKEAPEPPAEDVVQAGADPVTLAAGLGQPQVEPVVFSSPEAAESEVSLFSLPAEDAPSTFSAQIGGAALTFTLTSHVPVTATVTGCEGAVVGSVTIPQEITVDGVSYPVTALADRAFAEQRQLTQIWLPNSIQTIGSRAFYNCDHLAAACSYETSGGDTTARLFALPSSLTTLEMSTFFGCTRLVSVIIPAGVTQIGACAFSYCYSLGQNVTDASGNTYGVWFDPDSRLETIQQEAFSNCILLENISLPESLRTIELKAFYRCAGQRSDGTATGLSTLVLPDGLQTLEEEVFFQCVNLRTVSLPQTLRSIGSKAFFSCVGLESVLFRGEGLTSLGNMAFGYCHSLKNVTVQGKDGNTLPATLGVLPKWAFSNCLALEDFVLPEGLHTIQDYAFTDSGVTGVTFPASLSRIGLLAFEGCDRLTQLHWAQRPEDQPLRMDEKAFASCQGLVSVTLPPLSENSGTDIFYDCDQLTSVTLADGVQRIPPAAFRDCDRLSQVTLSSTLKIIGFQAFYSCPALTQITLPQGLTDIGALAFNRTGLTQVTLPASVETVALDPFGNNRALSAIHVEAGNAGGYYDENGVLFRKVKLDSPSVTAVVLCSYPAGKADLSQYAVPEGVAVLDHYAFHGNQTLETITFPESLTVVGDYAFNGCTHLSSAALASSVTVGADPFQDCPMLTQVSLPDSMTVVNSDYLPPDSRLTQVTLPASAIELEEFNNPFQYLPYLETILVADGNTAFQSIDGVLYSRDGSVLIAYPPNKPDDTFVLPETVAEIRALAFAGNHRLQHIVVPETVNTVGRSAFYDISPTAQVDFLREDAQFGNNKAYSLPFGFPEGIPSRLQVRLTHDPNDREGLADYIQTFYSNCGLDHPVPLENIQGGYFKSPAQTGDKFVVNGVVYTLSGENSVKVAENAHYAHTSVTIPSSLRWDGRTFQVVGVTDGAFAGTALEQATVLIDPSLVGQNAFGSAQVSYRAELTQLVLSAQALTYGDTLTVTLPSDISEGDTVTLTSGQFSASARVSGGTAGFPVDAAMADALGFDTPVTVTVSAGSYSQDSQLTLARKALTLQDLPQDVTHASGHFLRLTKPYDGTTLLDLTDPAPICGFPAFEDDLALRVTGSLRSAQAAPNLFDQVQDAKLSLVGEHAQYYTIGSDIRPSEHLRVAVGYGQLYIKSVDGVLQQPTFRRVFAIADGMRVADCALGGGQYVAYLPTVENGEVVSYETVDVSQGTIVYDEENHYPGLSSFEQQNVEKNRVYRWHFEPAAQSARSLDLSNYRFYGTVKLWDTDIPMSPDTMTGLAGENPALPAYVEEETPTQPLEPPLDGQPPAAPADDPPSLGSSPDDSGDNDVTSPTPEVSPLPSEDPSAPSTGVSQPPSEAPTDTSSDEPSGEPSDEPSGEPSDEPSESPSVSPSPSAKPSARASNRPVVVVSGATAVPTEEKVSISSSDAESAAAAAEQGTATLKPRLGSEKNALISLPVKALLQAITVEDGKVTKLAVSTPLATVTLSRAALESLVAQADGSTVTLRVASQEVPAAAQSVIGSHPAYDLTFKSARNAEISTFGGALVTVSIPYRLAAGERAEDITALLVKETGETERVPFSAWRNGRLVFETRHLSNYAVACLPTTFSDSLNHWAAAEIGYAASRGLLLGMDKYTFYPNGPVSWKMALTVLGRMDGIEPDPTAAWYDPYLDWGEETGLLPYAQDPNDNIERQEMAKLVAGFLALHGQSPAAGTIPPSSYLDRKAIGARYITDVGYLRELGLMQGHDNGTFGPQDPLTRAQLATLFRRLIERQLGLNSR